LTTVRQPFDAVAKEGLELLVRAIEHPQADPAPASDPPIELVLRSSTMPPRTTPWSGRLPESPSSQQHA
jgi:DNA-binding LacI/PurR family transcriptional regulator